ncbi:unnamed protein product [Meganyctiphanes norvegica]|uniref:Uncharacterized protein n=1 Tax=Meganyctiphanes norvegica TaxID=48144 RepID=A0AAV2QZU3_MEGNR
MFYPRVTSQSINSAPRIARKNRQKEGIDFGGSKSKRRLNKKIVSRALVGRGMKIYPFRGQTLLYCGFSSCESIPPRLTRGDSGGELFNIKNYVGWHEMGNVMG